jgi:hypothetical protein
MSKQQIGSLMSVRKLLKQIVDRPVLELTRTEDTATLGGSAADLAIPGMLAARQPSVRLLDPLAMQLTPKQRRAAEQLCELWSAVHDSENSLVSRYDRGPFRRAAFEPEMSDEDAERHSRLNKFLNAIGPNWPQVIDALYYRKGLCSVLVIAAALDRVFSIVTKNVPGTEIEDEICRDRR